MIENRKNHRSQIFWNKTLYDTRIFNVLTNSHRMHVLTHVKFPKFEMIY